MLAVALFGTVSGLQLRTFSQTPLPVQEAWIEWPRAEVAIPEVPALYVVRHATTAGQITWVGLYKNAREIGGGRSGGFLGAGVWLVGVSASAPVLVEYLHALVDQVERLATSAGTFTRRLSDIEREIDWHETLGRSLSASLRELQPGRGLCAGDLPHVLLDGAAGGAALLLDLVQEAPGIAGYRGAVISTSAATTTSARSLGRMRVLDLREWTDATMNALFERDRTLAAAKAIADRSEHAINELNTQLANERRNALDLQRTSQQLRQELATSRQSTFTLTTAIEARDRRIAHLSQSLELLQERKGSLEQALAQLTKQVDQLNAANAGVTSLVRERDSLQRLLQQAETDRNFWRGQAQALQSKAADTEAAPAPLDARIARYLENTAQTARPETQRPLSVGTRPDHSSRQLPTPRQARDEALAPAAPVAPAASEPRFGLDSVFGKVMLVAIGALGTAVITAYDRRPALAPASLAKDSAAPPPSAQAEAAQAAASEINQSYFPPVVTTPRTMQALPEPPSPASTPAKMATRATTSATAVTARKPARASSQPPPQASAPRPTSSPAKAGAPASSTSGQASVEQQQVQADGPPPGASAPASGETKPAP